MRASVNVKHYDVADNTRVYYTQFTDGKGRTYKLGDDVFVDGVGSKTKRRSMNVRTRSRVDHVARVAEIYKKRGDELRVYISAQCYWRASDIVDAQLPLPVAIMHLVKFNEHFDLVLSEAVDEHRAEEVTGDARVLHPLAAPFAEPVLATADCEQAYVCRFALSMRTLKILPITSADDMVYETVGAVERELRQLANVNTVEQDDAEYESGKMSAADERVPKFRQSDEAAFAPDSRPMRKVLRHVTRVFYEIDELKKVEEFRASTGAKRRDLAGPPMAGNTRALDMLFLQTYIGDVFIKGVEHAAQRAVLERKLGGRGAVIVLCSSVMLAEALVVHMMARVKCDRKQAERFVRCMDPHPADAEEYALEHYTEQERHETTTGKLREELRRKRAAARSSDGSGKRRRQVCADADIQICKVATDDGECD